MTQTPTTPRSRDHVMMLVYVPELKQAVYNLCGVKRITGSDVLILPASMSQHQMEVYIAFREEVGISCSSSVYLGSFE